MMRGDFSPGKGSNLSNDLEDRLRKALETRDRVEQQFRDQNQKLWAIMFIDASPSAQAVWKKDTAEAEALFDEYQHVAREQLMLYGPTFVDPAGGPQIVCCYEEVEQALKAANSLLDAMLEWNASRMGEEPLVPAIGLHKGYVVYRDGVLQQSNSANMAARVKGKAKPGQVLVSSELAKDLAKSQDFKFSKVGTYELKNIPEPQDLYEALPAKLPAPMKKAASKLPAYLAAKVQAGAGAVSGEKRTHNWAMVYIDVCGSTKKFWSYGDREATRLIEEYQKICNKTFTSQGCCFLRNCEGDQIVAGFELDNIDRAAVAAIQILQGLFKRNLTVRDNQKVQAAIGVHVGEMIFQGEEMLQSKDMRIGKMTQSSATAEDILITQQVVDTMHPDLHQFIAPFKTIKFEGLPDPTTLYTLKWFRTQLNTTHLRKILTTLYTNHRPKYR
ncbi:MAG: hypothetical protein GC154_08565 [bacterium]|nr:hypothetical protein [bacterium]